MRTLMEAIVLTTEGMWDVAEEPAASTIEFVVREPDTPAPPVCEPPSAPTTQQPEQSEAPHTPSGATAAAASSPIEYPEPRAAKTEHPERSVAEPKDAVAIACTPISIAIDWPDNEWDDPRPDLADDHAVWAQALLIAHRLDGGAPSGCFWVLHGLRGQGAAIEEVEGFPPWQLARGEINAGNWARWVQAYVEPVAVQVAWVLREVK